MTDDALRYFVVGIAFGAGIIIGGTLMWLAVDWLYRKFGRP